MKKLLIGLFIMTSTTSFARANIDFVLDNNTKSCAGDSISLDDFKAILNETQVFIAEGLRATPIMINLVPGSNAEYDDNLFIVKKIHSITYGICHNQKINTPFIIHEYGHPLFYEALVQSSYEIGSELNDCSKNGGFSRVCMNLPGIIAPFTELYSDLMASLILKNPDIIFETFKLEFKQERQIPFYGLSADETIKEMQLRSFSYQCSKKDLANIKMRDSYTVTCPSRKIVWEKLNSYKNKCGTKAALNKGMEIIFHSMDMFYQKHSEMNILKTSYINELNEVLRKSIDKSDTMSCN